MRLAGVGTVNEAREELGLDPLDDDELGELTLQEFEAEFTGGDGGDEAASTPDEDAEQTQPSYLPPPKNRAGERAGLELANKQEVDTQQFDSSNLDQGLYDHEDRELYIRFDRDDGVDSLYVYLNVPPAEWEALQEAASHGSYHYDNIRLDYQYEEITDNHERLPVN